MNNELFMQANKLYIQLKRYLFILSTQELNNLRDEIDSEIAIRSKNVL
jgi:hypothetical protein